jgi:HEAT repeat protein
MQIPDAHRSFKSRPSISRVALFVTTLVSVLVLNCAADETDEANIAVQRLIQASRIYDEKEMLAASQALAEIGAPAVPSLSSALNDFDDNVRWQAIVALGKIGRPALDTIPRLLEALDDVDPDVRAAAAETFGLLGAKHTPIVDRLKQAMNDEHSLVRASALWSLWELTGRRESIVDLAGLLPHQDWMVAARADRHLTSIGRPAVQELTQRLESMGSPGRHGIARTLGHIGRQAEPAVPALVGCLDDSNAELSAAAARALGQIGHSAVLDVTRFLERAPTRGRANAVRALGLIGPDACDSLPMLLAELDAPKPDRAVTLNSIRAVGQIGVGRADCAEWIAFFLTSRDADIRGATCAALGAIGIANSQARRHLNQMVRNDPQDFVRQAASAALASLRET